MGVASVDGCHAHFLLRRSCSRCARWGAAKARGRRTWCSATPSGAAILLGLEILVAADLIRTITSKPSIEDALILGLIVLIRTVLSMSIQIEIEGVLPWRKALLTSGAQVLGDAVARDRAASVAASAAPAETDV